LISPTATPRRLLVTGASGFVAGHLVPRLRLGFPESELVLCGNGGETLDISDDAAVQALVARVQPQLCVHLAAISAVPAARENPNQAWQVNLHGSLSLGRALLAHARGCILLYASSAEIYGRSFTAGQALNEAAAAAPMNTYAATKAAADLALGAMVGDGLKVIRVRPFNHTGPGQTADFAVPAFARQIARIEAGRQEPVLNVGALDPLRDFLDVRDVCDAYVSCLKRAAALAAGTVFNIASGVPRNIGDVLRRLLELSGVTAEISTGTALLRPSEIPIALGDAAAARAALDWVPRIPWDTTMRDVLDDWRARVAAEDI
jgi:nucleoside-diphosphate-sugar epimerase